MTRAAKGPAGPVHTGPLVRTVTSAVCLVRGCDWVAAGPADAVDLESRRHTGEGGLKGGPTPGHATLGSTLPWTPRERPR